MAVAALAGRLARQLGGPGEDALQRLALEVAHAAHRAVVLANEVVEDDAGPLARGELGLPQVGDDAQLHPVDPDLLAHRVVAQDIVALLGDLGGSGGLQGAAWRRRERGTVRRDASINKTIRR